MSAALTDAGFAVLRFDFTGLGQSEGDFANTDFSSNTHDVVAAAEWLRANHGTPQLLVGHSLGGAAMLAVAADIPGVRAVATIAAPSSPDHVTGLFAGQLDDIERSGAADVEIAGRTFTIRRDFVDDLRSHRVVDQVGRLGVPLLLLHSPVDNVVSVDHAARLFGAARHPKSFVSLDGADHLLSDPADARYAASMIAAFADRYIVDARDRRPRSEGLIVAETAHGNYVNHVVVGRHHFIADEPEAANGQDAGPAPYDLLASALGACTSMTVRMYADRKGMPLDRVMVEVRHAKVDVDDCPECRDNPRLTGTKGRIDRFERLITLAGELSDAERDRLLQVSERCPVHRTLEGGSAIATRLVD